MHYEIWREADNSTTVRCFYDDGRAEDGGQVVSETQDAYLAWLDSGNTPVVRPYIPPAVQYDQVSPYQPTIEELTAAVVAIALGDNSPALTIAAQLNQNL